MKKSIFGFALCFGLLCASCTNRLNDDTEPIVNVPVDFNISMRESLGEADNNLQLYIETTKAYECTNYSINVSLEHYSNGLVLSLQDIIEPDDCVEGIDVARTNLTIHDLQNGSYDFYIILKDAVSNDGTLIVSDVAYMVQISEKNGVAFEHTTLRRVPEQLIWGYFSYEGMTDAEVETLQNTFAQATTTANLAEGYYGYFTSSADGLEIHEATPLYSQFQTFAFKYGGAASWLEELANTYNWEQPNARMQLRIYAADGAVY